MSRPDQLRWLRFIDRLTRRALRDADVLDQGPIGRAREISENCPSSEKKNRKKPRYDKINPDPYAHAKRTARRLAATPALRSYRGGPASRTPPAHACRLLECPHLAVARAPHLNLSPGQLPCITKSTPTPSSSNRFTTTCGSNIPNGSSQMANPPCVILTSRALPSCSTL